MGTQQILPRNFYLVQWKCLQVMYPKTSRSALKHRWREEGRLELRYWRTEGALASSYAGLKCSWWSFNLRNLAILKKRCLTTVSDSLKNSSVKSETQGQATSQRFVSWGSPDIIWSSKYWLSPPECGLPYRIHHGGSNLSHYYQNAHCRWNGISHPGNNPLFTDPLWKHSLDSHTAFKTIPSTVHPCNEAINSWSTSRTAPWENDSVTLGHPTRNPSPQSRACL